MNLLQQYLSGNEIEITLPALINDEIVTTFGREYKFLLQEKHRSGADFNMGSKNLRFIIDSGYNDDLRDFDLLFISYVALLKLDFPNLSIAFVVPANEDPKKIPGYVFKINQHRLHLQITGQKEIFKLFIGNREFNLRSITQSGSYIPPLIITPDLLKSYFERKGHEDSFEKLIAGIAATPLDENLFKLRREDFLSKIRERYIKAAGSNETWTFSSLSGLYLIEALYNLYILRFVAGKESGAGDDYAIGSAISKMDPESPHKFRRTIYELLQINDVFNFSDVERYFLALLVQNSDLFSIPTSAEEILQKIKPLLLPSEIIKFSTDSRALKAKYIDIYAENLQRIINYSRDITYALQELSKNVTEHTHSKCGVITARIYSLDKIDSLKNVDETWKLKFMHHHKFIDINVIDSGIESIKTSYQANLRKEKSLLTEVSSPVQESVLRNYDEDIVELEKYQINSFFNFHSLKLFHQINRTKARLGLLIFSQTILNDKKSFVKIASNDLWESSPSGFEMFEHDSNISERHTSFCQPLGTNYNFLIPLNERFELQKQVNNEVSQEAGISSSIFLELQRYMNSSENAVPLRYFALDPAKKIPSSKYEKIDFLKSQIGTGNTTLKILNAEDVKEILFDSSDWVRFLANMQFMADYTRELIIYNIDPHLYIEILNILRLFDKIANDNLGFWKKDRFVLFFIPVFQQHSRFWFNSLLCCTDYLNFLNINKEINRYHFNFLRVMEDEPVNEHPVQDIGLNGLLFSKSKKLLNFELIIKDLNGLSLFEETTYSLLNIEIESFLYEDELQ